ncbi:MAG: hypothetical protein LQ350_004631 [Teloschistes chrysophthalmus]|nr:MAG: hypothetical protein LQ350_004631 [Niorma chrysophthalma]
MAILPKKGVIHNDPAKTALAKARRNAMRNERQRQLRAAKAERKANDPANAAAERRPGHGLTREDINHFREWVRSATASPWAGEALERFAQEREQAVEKLAPGEKLRDWWGEGPKERKKGAKKTKKSIGGVALPVSGEEGEEQVDEGGKEEYPGGPGAWGAVGIGAEKEEDGEDGEDEDDMNDKEGEGGDGEMMVDEDA